MREVVVVDYRSWSHIIFISILITLLFLFCLFKKNYKAVEDLRIAHQNGFDNISTLTSDPDLRSLQGTPDFEELMDEINPRRNKGLFGLF